MHICNYIALVYIWTRTYVRTTPVDEIYVCIANGTLCFIEGVQSGRGISFPLNWRLIIWKWIFTYRHTHTHIILIAYILHAYYMFEYEVILFPIRCVFVIVHWTEFNMRGFAYPNNFSVFFLLFMKRKPSLALLKSLQRSTFITTHIGWIGQC